MHDGPDETPRRSSRDRASCLPDLVQRFDERVDVARGPLLGEGEVERLAVERGSPEDPAVAEFFERLRGGPRPPHRELAYERTRRRDAEVRLGLDTRRGPVSER